MREINHILESPNVGAQMHRWLSDLFPLHRAHMGEGVRQSLRMLETLLPLEVHEIPSGSKVCDWYVPQEWRIRDAYIADSEGNRIVDYRRSNLQVVSNSQPMMDRLGFKELVPHLNVLSEDLPPDWIPYRTLFFKEGWGFSVSRRQWDRLSRDPAEEFQVCIDSDFFDGSLTYGEAHFPGSSPETILVYAHCCHPSLANDNLSGMIVAAYLGHHLQHRLNSGDLPQKTYRIVFAPATIGAITWLSINQLQLSRICGGLVLSLLGGPGHFTYKKSRRGGSLIDRAMASQIAEGDFRCDIREFTPLGYDERQFCSPGFNLPMGCLTRTPWGEFPEYHTSGDDLEYVTPESLQQSFHFVVETLQRLEWNFTPLNAFPFGEPNLGRHGLYRGYGQLNRQPQFQEAVLWILNMADGSQDLLDIAGKSQLPLALLKQAADVLQQKKLLTTPGQGQP